MAENDSIPLVLYDRLRAMEAEVRSLRRQTDADAQRQADHRDFEDFFPVKLDESLAVGGCAMAFYKYEDADGNWVNSNSRVKVCSPPWHKEGTFAVGAEGMGWRARKKIWFVFGECPV
jgi:hypothetical protein